MDKFIELHEGHGLHWRSNLTRITRVSIRVKHIVSVRECKNGNAYVSIFKRNGDFDPLVSYRCIESYDEVMALINGSAM